MRALHGPTWREALSAARVGIRHVTVTDPRTGVVTRHYRDGRTERLA